MHFTFTGLPLLFILLEFCSGSEREAINPTFGQNSLQNTIYYIDEILFPEENFSQYKNIKNFLNHPNKGDEFIRSKGFNNAAKALPSLLEKLPVGVKFGKSLRFDLSQNKIIDLLTSSNAAYISKGIYRLFYSYGWDILRDSTIENPMKLDRFIDELLKFLEIKLRVSNEREVIINEFLEVLGNLTHKNDNDDKEKPTLHKNDENYKGKPTSISSTSTPNTSNFSLGLIGAISTFGVIITVVLVIILFTKKRNL